MALTLIEQAKTQQDEVLRGVIETYAASSPILERLPFRGISGNAYAYNQESVLPGIAFRSVNAAYSESVGVLLPATEKLKIMGGDADTDKFLVATDSGSGRRAIDIKMKAKAAALYFDKIFIDGDEGTTPTQFDGLNVRLASGSQHLHADAGTGTAGANLSENLVQALIDLIDGTPDALLMGKAVRRQLNYLFKGSSIFGFTDPNYFGTRVSTFSGIPILVLDKDNDGNEILAMDETEGSTSGTAGSMYALKFGADQYLSGIQNGPIQGYDLGELDTKPVLRYRIEWYMGLAMFHPRCAARLQGITKVAGTY